MSSMLSTGVSGLLAFQTALDTTSHNISNSSTTGYSRQSADLATTQPQYLTGNWMGTGVSVDTIKRSYSDLVATQVRSSSSSKNQFDIYSSLADQVNNLFGDSSTGLSASLQKFADSFQSVANSPSSSAERQALLSQAQTLVTQLKSYDGRLSDLHSQVNSQLDSEATTVTGLAHDIAQLNQMISSAVGKGSDTPNDLLDQRDNLLDQLATHVNISTVKQTDGTVNVFIGTGQALVTGATAADLITQTDSYDASRKGLAIRNGVSTVDVTDALSGGSVGGLLSFRSELLDPATNALGRIAASISDAVNSQQNAGMNLSGSLGANMFAVGGVNVLPNSANAGTGSASVTRSDVSALTTGDYLLTKTASGWSLRRTDTGQSITMSGSGTALDPFVADGLSIVTSGTASAGDRFLIRPTSNVVSGMNVALTDPNGVAAAAPVITSASSTNTGNATITQGSVTDASDPQLRTSVTIQFLSGNRYTTDGGTTTVSYTSGQPITVNLNGWQATISGTPQVGDTFTVKDNAGGTGDNRNALLLANLFDKNYMDSGKTTINGAIGQWVADIGVKSSQAQSNLTTQTNLYNDNISAQQSVSGVNLDEEAGNLLRYQQAYAAAAKVISTSNALFTSLLQAIG